VIIVQPLAVLFATSVDEAGAKALFYSTSDRYSVGDGTVPLAEGIEKSPKSEGGVFLSNEKSESADNEKLLVDFRARGVDEQVWRHTMLQKLCATKIGANQKVDNVTNVKDSCGGLLVAREHHVRTLRLISVKCSDFCKTKG
jgi:hypothetical protein